jgi:hypothetical protein
LAPPGACTSATSPSTLPISARAIGELMIEIRPLLEVGLVVADDLVGDLRVGRRCLLPPARRRAEHHPAVGVQIGRIDDLRSGQLALDVLDAAFDEALLVLGGLVLGVLRQVALGARFGDRLDHGGRSTS